MDIATGLTLLAQAAGIVKDLRDIDKEFDSAVLKAQMADVYGTLADVKIALSDARESIHERDQKIRELEGKISALSSGETCIICNVGRMKIIDSNPHEHFGILGVQERTLECNNCGRTESQMYDPSRR